MKFYNFPILSLPFFKFTKNPSSFQSTPRCSSHSRCSTVAVHLIFFFNQLAVHLIESKFKTEEFDFWGQGVVPSGKVREDFIRDTNHEFDSGVREGL
ncbi:hypothetical protein LWI29_021505 [Acer saccharum]|uniref:Uncharacterized protein n=1 Tax=Acer saccharum TaxID=4024 RepID=A0AA39W7H2_ACESA|nr:hypothetical protein LWI29_021505 [Acer saccharum]